LRSSLAYCTELHRRLRCCLDRAALVAGLRDGAVMFAVATAAALATLAAGRAL